MNCETPFKIIEASEKLEKISKKYPREPIRTRKEKMELDINILFRDLLNEVYPNSNKDVSIELKYFNDNTFEIEINTDDLEANGLIKEVIFLVDQRTNK